MSNQSKTILYLVLLVLAGVGGFFVGKTYTTNNSFKPGATPLFTSHPMFRSQTATIQGVINGITSSSITVSDDQSHTETFPVAKSFTFYPETPNATPSSNLNAVAVNRRAVITLVFDKDKFYVVSVAYIPTPKSSVPQ